MGAREPVLDDVRARRVARKEKRERWLRVRLAEKAYAKRLRSIAAEVGKIVKGHAPNGVVKDPGKLSDALRRYKELIRPWASRVAKKTLADVALRDEDAWNSLAGEMGTSVRESINRAPIGRTLASLEEEQVELITSLPEEASKRVHKLSVEALYEGTRAKEIAAEILRTGEVTRARANLIARTEIGRASTHVARVRAEAIGSIAYVWRTARDSDVRPIHRKLEGKVFQWDDPPVAGEAGERAHPGAIYNCRCYPEPILPDVVI